MNFRREITYLPANVELKTRIQQDWASNAGDLILLDKESFSLVALDAGVPIGVISAYKRPIAEPLDELSEVYINILEVSEEYRRAGIGSALVEAVFAWARQQGIAQVITFSMKPRVEALHLWYKLGFALVKIDTPQQMEAPYGFYVAKRL